ncbi:hypothetical protein SARC_04178 [Sphaeroforma arctica JP610]|uniref:Uncharacterized protein n=1 Tax=Sphaeroforma arctica JP610 TaxID=667725 RepID=A0A0L0G5T2_9EUKA|nr:hypothetical protein SARC_04178 [Sphaeroforma arctica JP610]KNC83573.1 hypothetical protein SARC_04178 [Sphaeroforma arctica JP610]|eukprot:XP_014157475.1 hypothetical protein SARC_04178 [Sphaeroforma arctica JP610]
MNYNQLHHIAVAAPSNLRISGLEALLLLCQEMSPMVARHTARMYAIIDCLTDKKQEVRDGVLAVFLQLAIITTPKTVTERLQPAFAHKAWTINQQALVITKELLKVYKAQLIDSVLINHVFKLLSAAKPDVREEATSTLACMYELLDHNNRPKFRSGIERRRQPGHSLDTVWAALNNVDKCSAPPPETFPTPPSNSQPVATRPMAAVPTPKREPSKNKTTKSKYTLIDEHEFSDFSSCEPLRWAVTSDMLEGTITRLEKFSVEDWDKRRDELRTMRTYLNSDVTALPDYMSQAKRIIPFIGDNMALDLRSQVSKEACVTLCHLAQTMGPHFKVFVPEVISVLMRLLHRNQFFIQCSDCTMKRILTACANPALISKVFVPIIRDKFDLIRSKTAELMPSKFKEMLQRERIKHGLGLEDANTCISRKDISRTDMTTRTQTSVHSPYAARGVQAQAQAHTQAHTSTHAQPAMMAANEATPVRMKSSVSTRPASAMRIGRPGQAPTNRSTGAVAGTAGKGSRSSAALFGARSNGHSAFTNKASHPMRSTTAAQLKNTAQSHTAGSMARARSAYSHSAISKVRPGNHGNGSSRANEPAGEVYSDKPQTITSEHLGRTASLKTKGRTVTKQLSHQLSLPVRGRQTNVPPRIQEHRINTGNVDKARGNREHIMQGNK